MLRSFNIPSWLLRPRLAIVPSRVGNGSDEHLQCMVFAAGHVFEDASHYTAHDTTVPMNTQLRSAPLAPQAANSFKVERQEKCDPLKPPAGSKDRRPLSVNAPEFRARSTLKQSSGPGGENTAQQQGSGSMQQGSTVSSPLRAAAPPFTPHSALPPTNPWKIPDDGGEYMIL